MRNIFLLLILLVITGNSLLAQSNMTPQLKVENADTIYYLFKTPSLVLGKKYPLIIWLHGSGEKGNDNKKQYCNGLEELDKYTNQLAFQSYLCAPQCPENQYWSFYDLKNETHSISKEVPIVQIQLYLLIQNLIKQYPIDTKRVYLIGLSMGGYGVWDLLSRYPGTFAGAVPMCGGGDPKKVNAFCKIPIWAFHGQQDDVVKVSNSINVMKAISNNNCNINSKLTIVENEGHGVWNTAIRTPGLLEWLFAQRL